jgi:hypothetical protein
LLNDHNKLRQVDEKQEADVQSQNDFISSFDPAVWIAFESAEIGASATIKAANIQGNRSLPAAEDATD